MEETNAKNENNAILSAMKAIFEGRIQEALSTIEERPVDLRGRLVRAFGLYMDQRYQEAIDVFSTEDQEIPEVLAMIARCRMALGDVDGMRLTLNSAWIKGLSTEQFFGVVSEILRHMGISEGAEIVSVLVPGLRNDVASRMSLDIEAGRFESAIARADSAKEQSAAVWMLKAVALAAKGEIDEAEAIITKHEADELSDVEKQMFSLVKMVFLLRRNRLKEALLTQNPSELTPVVKVAYAEMLLQNSDQDMASELVNQIDESDLEINERFDLVEVLLQLGNWQRAESILMDQQNRFIADSDSGLRNNYYLTHCKRIAGDTAEANRLCAVLETDLRKILARNPWRRHLYILRFVCLRDIGETEKAKEMLDFLKLIYPDDARMRELKIV